MTLLYFNDTNLDCPDREEKFVLANTAMMEMIKLHNAMNTEMQQKDPDLPPSIEVRKMKAELLGTLALAYRTAYKNAYTKGAFKPYTHMTRHVEEQQLRVQYDLMRYSCQGQEHYGKVMKQLTKTMTNFKLGSTTIKDAIDKTDGKARPMDKSYVQQIAEHAVYRKHLNSVVAVRGSEYSVQKRNIREWIDERKRLKRQQAMLSAPTTKRGKLKRKQLIKSEQMKKERKTITQTDRWAPHHTPASTRPPARTVAGLGVRAVAALP